jgi:hypothetical protein
MKFKIKGKKYAVFYFTGKRKIFFYIYDVIVKQILKKRAAYHYFF